MARKTLEESSYNKHFKLYCCYSRLSIIALDKWIDLMKEGNQHTDEAHETFNAYKEFYRLSNKHLGISNSVFTRVMNNY